MASPALGFPLRLAKPENFQPVFDVLLSQKGRPFCRPYLGSVDVQRKSCMPMIGISLSCIYCDCAVIIVYINDKEREVYKEYCSVRYVLIGVLPPNKLTEIPFSLPLPANCFVSFRDKIQKFEENLFYL